jgi:hypothetical protein
MNSLAPFKSDKNAGRCRIHRMIENTKSIFPACFTGLGVLSKGLTFWLKGARPPSKSTNRFLKSNYEFGKVKIWRTQNRQMPHPPKKLLIS